MAEQKTSCGCGRTEKREHGHGRHVHENGCCQEKPGHTHGNHRHGDCGCGHRE